MKALLSEESLRDLTERLRKSNEEFTQHYPGETGRRQPVHTVYGGAHLFKSDSAQRLGSLARRSLDQFGPDFITFAHGSRAARSIAVERQWPCVSVGCSSFSPERIGRVRRCFQEKEYRSHSSK